MFSVARSIEIACPPGRVYAAYTDLERWPRWVPHFRALTPLTEGPLAKGFRARVRERYGALPQVWEVTSIEPGRCFAWTAAPLPGLRLTVDHVAEPSGVRTRATLALHIDGLLAPLVAPVALRISRGTFDRSLAMLREMLE